MAEFANGLRSEGDHAGNAWGAGALGQLQQSQGAQHDPNLLDAATQQLGEFLLVLLCDFYAQGWTTHTPSMRQNISEWNCFLESF
jgi:hypothetical protein